MTQSPSSVPQSQGPATASREVPLFRMSVSEAEVEAAQRVLRRGTAWAAGPEVAQFEAALQQESGAAHCVAVGSGTAALHLMLRALGVGPGDEVVVPSFTFIATANAVELCGARAVFAEVEPDSLALDPADVAKRITPRTKAVLPIHYAGGAARIEALAEVARRAKVPLLEDAAQSFGTRIGGRMAGTFGHAGIYSFCQNKLVTTAGEGGAVVTDDAALARRVRELRSHGRVETQDYFRSVHDLDYVEPGYNYRISSVQAAVGLAQLSRLDRLLEGRRAAAAEYDRQLQGVAGVQPVRAIAGATHAYQMYTVRFQDEAARERIAAHLSGRGIGCKVYFSPSHLATAYRARGWKPGDLPRTEALSRLVLSLPMHAELPAADARHVALQVRDALHSPAGA